MDCLDSRLDEQKDDLEDLQDFLKKRAEVERKYSKGSDMNIEGRSTITEWKSGKKNPTIDVIGLVGQDLDNLSEAMLKKHRDKEKGGSSVWELLRVLIRDVRDSAKYFCTVLSCALLCCADAQLIWETCWAPSWEDSAAPCRPTCRPSTASPAPPARRSRRTC